MIRWFQDENGIAAIFDATNATRAKRESLLEQCRQLEVQVMFIESVCEDEGLRLANAIEMQKFAPDYELMDPELAVQDFKARAGHYKGHYETMTEKDLTYIKLIDAGSQVIVSQIQGYLQSRVLYYLMNLRIAPRNLYFSRHGESLFNVMGLLGGDSDLSARGKQYSRALPIVVAQHIPNSDKLTVWTSIKRRTIQTAQHLPHKKLAWKALDELEAGKADGLTYEQVEEQFPEDFVNRDNDKFNYRYQDGESYRDVVARLEPVIMDLERQRDILVIGHQAILRCLYAYFMNYSYESLPYIKIPLHTLIQLTPGPYRCEEKRFKVDIAAVDTHRPKPKSKPTEGPVSTHHEPLVDVAPIVLPPTPVEDLPMTPEHATKTLQDAAASETPKIIVSTLTTNTFRCAVYPTADSIPPRTASTSPAEASTTSKPVLPMAAVEQVNENAKMIAEAMIQAATMESPANPAVALKLDEVVTPVLDQEGLKRNPLSRSVTPLGLNTTSASYINGSSSARSASLQSVATPPLSPVPSDRKEAEKGRTEESSLSASGVVALCGVAGEKKSDSKNQDPFQLSANSQALTTACV
ncbi:Fructose-2,6-bisphosphatase [Modicella reniformis]|uniref:fructose-2,6-bisphosphate 2-phosphatase n=1 Tax=Modicella reniformis TaxID=1440133 RepID=A0A9P6LSH4_9FUNG|nr:Fructose-2,6-bisphosphatase [Modicella reniformis]